MRQQQTAAVRKDMRTWLISDKGEHWSVKLDVRDLGGHLDTTCRAWGRTLVARVFGGILDGLAGFSSASGLSW